MDETKELVLKAQKGDIDAFCNLIKRFQDMAYGYGFSLLGDFHLAQDAAQEAFVDAYRCLYQLRDPAAFAGWFRRIVFKQCDRYLRQRRLKAMPVDEARGIASNLRGPDEIAERNQLKNEVLAAISALPERERTATSLYYINGYSQKEISGFLEVPENTVKSRLHSSRKKLKERMMRMVDKTMKDSRLPDNFAAIVARKVASEEDLQAARKYLSGSYTGKRQPEGFRTVESAKNAEIYIVREPGKIISAGYDGEMQWGIGEKILTVARPDEFAGESAGVPDPTFMKSMLGSFRMARERECALAILHGSMYDHAFCWLVPTFYYCVAGLPVKIAQKIPALIRSGAVRDEKEQRSGEEAFLKDVYAAKITAFLGGGDMRVIEKNGDVIGYYRANPGVFKKARKVSMPRPFGYINRITIKNKEATLVVLLHAAEMAEEAGEDEILILESHETIITQTILSLGGSYYIRPSCPLVGLDAEMAAILDLEKLTNELKGEFKRRLTRLFPVKNASFSFEMDGTAVGFIWKSGALDVVSEKQKIHCVLPRWIVTRLYMGYYSGEDILLMGPIPWDRSDGKNPDNTKLDMQPFNLPEREAALFRSLFPKLWPCSLPDPDVWPWVIGEPYPEYQHPEKKTVEMKAQIDALRFPWIGL